jgi:4-amino-4-deoxy-L-arabinose transferase-like glycosyltransferase
MADGQAITRSTAARFNDSIIGRGLAFLTAGHGRAAAALILLSLLAYLPGLQTIPPVDRDEPRFAQATKQMLETGDYVDIRLQEVPRYKKPVGIYWLQAALVRATGQGPEAPIGAYRLASLFGATLAVLLAYWAALPLFGRRAAFIGAAALSLSLILAVEAHLAKTDATLLLTVLLAQGALARIYLPREGGRPPLSAALLFWLGIGLGILVKGPVIVMVSGLTIAALVALDRKAEWLKGLRPLVGVPLAAAIVLPWFLAILKISGGAFLEQSIGTDLLGKVGSGAEGHSGPPGLHFLLFWFIFFPAVMLAPLAVPFVWRNRRLAAVRFALAWIVPNWIVFEAVTTKLPHYTLPLYPAIAMLVGAAVIDGLPTGTIWTRLAAIPAAIFAVAVPLAGVVLLAVLEGAVSVVGIGSILVALALSAFAVRASFRDAPLAAASLVCVAALVGYVTVFGAILPRLDAFRVSGRLAEAVAAAGCPAPQVAAAGYVEPSLVFLVGTGTELVKGAEAADFLAGDGCRVALVEARQAARFTARAKVLGLVLDKRATVTGIAIGGFRTVEVGVYRAAPAVPSG